MARSRRMTHIWALLPLLLCSSVQSTHPHPTSAPLTTGGEYRNGGNDTNTTVMAADNGNGATSATDAEGVGDSNSTTTAASAAAAEAGAIVGIDSAAIPEYAGSVSFLQRNRRHTQRNLRRKYVQGG